MPLLNLLCDSMFGSYIWFRLPYSFPTSTIWYFQCAQLMLVSPQTDHDDGTGRKMHTLFFSFFPVNLFLNTMPYGIFFIVVVPTRSCWNGYDFVALTLSTVQALMPKGSLCCFLCSLLSYIIPGLASCIAMVWELIPNIALYKYMMMIMMIITIIITLK